MAQVVDALATATQLALRAFRLRLALEGFAAQIVLEHTLTQPNEIEGDAVRVGVASDVFEHAEFVGPEPTLFGKISGTCPRFTSRWGAMQQFRRAAWALGLVGLQVGCGDGGAPIQDAVGGQSSSAGQTSSGGSESNPQSTAGNNGGGVAGGASAAGNPSGGASGGGGRNSGGAGAGSAGAAGSGGVGSVGDGGGRPTIMTNKVFSQCRLHFGTTDSKAKQNAGLIPELDFFTPAWMGQSDTFDQKFVCDEGKDGAVLGKQVPVIVAYVSAFYVKRHKGNVCDCNVTTCGQTDGKPNDLCHFGAQYIKESVAAIVNVYKNYAQGYAACYGTTRPIIFEMEPDWYQYIDDTKQSSPMSKAEAGTILGQYVAALKQSLPNAYFSIDISPWVDDNGTTNGKDWYSHFDLSQFTYVNTSGGNTLGANTKIRSENNMTWSGVSGVAGKGVLADTGYGANGVSAGHDANWDDVGNLNARLADGVVSISQYNPKSDWGTTIKAIRSQLKTPDYCP